MSEASEIEKRESVADVLSDIERRKKMLTDAIYAAPVCDSTERLSAQVEILDEFYGRIKAAWERDCEYPKSQSLDADKLTGKTISELTTDLRQISKYHYARGNIEQGQFCRVMADRIEAAWKRQEQAYLDQIRDAVNMIGHEKYVAEHEQKPPVCNAAAMREALHALKEGFRDIDLAHDSLEKEIYELANAALSAPARNCDLYATATEALKAQDVAFNEDNFKNGECRLGCPGCDDGLIDCKILWLFAPAAERKGEAK